MMKSFIRGLYDVFFTYTDKHVSKVEACDNRSNWYLVSCLFALTAFMGISAMVIISNTHADANIPTNIVYNMCAVSHILFLVSMVVIAIGVAIVGEMFSNISFYSVVSIGFDISCLMLLLISNIDIYVSSNKSDGYLNKICITSIDNSKARFFYCWNVDAKSIEDRQLIKKYNELTATTRGANEQ